MIPSRYCLGCRYPLDLLPENRCPECGRAFDPCDPATFAPCAAKPIPASVRRIGKWIVGGMAAATLLICVEGGLDSGRRYETCRLCGASSVVRFFCLWGIGGDYGRVAFEGPVSQFIQAQTGHPCAHSWWAADIYGGGLFRRWAGTCSGFSSRRMVAALEGIGQHSSEFLKAKQLSDPDFADHLKVAIGKGESGESFSSLMIEAYRWAKDRPIAAMQPGKHAD